MVAVADNEEAAAIEAAIEAATKAAQGEAEGPKMFRQLRDVLQKLRPQVSAHCFVKLYLVSRVSLLK